MSAQSLTTPGSPGSFRRQGRALLAYVILLAGFLATAVASISNLLDSFAALNDSRAALARLDRQQHSTRQDSSSAADIGPPFLSGKTITIAGAALQERVEAAVKKAGGNVLSSQIDLRGPHSAEGFIGLTESLEIDQASLQPLLYDLEAGMPYLFVENLAIQAPQAFGEAEGTPMRVLVVVSGQWRESQ
jgi:general secretion pathway protein M